VSKRKAPVIAIMPPFAGGKISPGWPLIQPVRPVAPWSPDFPYLPGGVMPHNGQVTLHRSQDTNRSNAENW